MGSDRQSILLHENGKKHREAVEADLKRRREDKAKKEKDKNDLEKVFAQVNAAAAAGGSGGTSFGGRKPWEQPPVSSQFVAPVPSNSVATNRHHQQRQHKPKVENRDVKPEQARSAFTTVPTETKIVPDANAGHYDIEGTSYLDGSIYAPILEEGMPIQLWIGDPSASDVVKRDLRSFNYWKIALLAKVVRKGSGQQEEVTSCHVSYLQNSTDDDETLESNVSPSRIRLVLGSDPLIPSTLEEAHLALLGGEQTIQVDGNNTTDGNAKQEIDENTGLSTWSTTTIRKVSSHYEQNQERKRKRQHEKELAEYKEKKEKEIKARKMEEAKYANAHDSALGAYDVWSSATSAVEGKTAAYKGVDIHKEAKVEVADTAKSLSKGMGSVAFKKKKVKKKSIRRTSADD